MKCPFCKNKAVVKDGRTNANSQRLRCKSCGKRFVTNGKYSGYGNPGILAAARMRFNGKSLRLIAANLGVNHQTVSNWLSSIHAGQGLVYLIKDGDRYKIGKTKYLSSRLPAIRNEIGREIELVHLIKSDDYNILERVLHDRFSDKRIEGEWFRLNRAEVAYIKSL